MVGVLSALVILALSILVTRVATVALSQTGLSRAAAAFQSRSAFTGVGFTTEEAETVVNHPVRRRIIATLMLLGNVGLVTGVSSLILGFVDTGDVRAGWNRLGILAVGVLVLFLLARSPVVDRVMSRVIGWALSRWTRLDVRDYEELLHLSGEYRVRELAVEEDDWLAGRTLGDLKLRDEGVNVLGMEKASGDYVGAPRGETRIDAGDQLLVYGRGEALEELDQRRRGGAGDAAHEEAVAEEQKIRRQEREEREKDEKAEPRPGA